MNNKLVLNKNLVDRLESSIDMLDLAIGSLKNSLMSRKLTMDYELRLAEYDNMVVKQKKLVSMLREKLKDSSQTDMKEEDHRLLKLIEELTFMLQRDAKDLFEELTYGISSKDRYYDC